MKYILFVNAFKDIETLIGIGIIFFKSFAISETFHLESSHMFFIFLETFYIENLRHIITRRKEIVSTKRFWYFLHSLFIKIKILNNTCLCSSTTHTSLIFTISQSSIWSAEPACLIATSLSPGIVILLLHP